MTADRFDEVERICLEALEQAPDRRTAFLDEACRDDADLRAQVDRLLAGASNAEQFLEAPPAEMVALVLRAGDRLGPYEGRRFYTWQSVAVPTPPPPVTHVRLMQNWVGELKQQAGR